VKKAAGSKVAAKYRNPATGDSWSGRGLKPKWLTTALAGGAQLSDFAV
jgi:DNA-binding protein H-NS